LRIESIQLQRKSPFMKDYLQQDKDIMRFFDYQPLLDFKNRLQDVYKRTYKRKELSHALYEMNQTWGAEEQALHNIERLQDEHAVVIIGGQQAGLLSGPTYTINKIISIIQLANQQEKELEVPVIPVFWIAGEDHDFAEINHVNIVENGHVKKHQLNQFVQERIPVSDIQIDSPLAKKWIDELFVHLQETKNTKSLYETVHRCLNKSKTYVDFFARVINDLFSDEGLVLVDSNHSYLRKIESDYFKVLINQQENLAKEIYETTHSVRQSGYALSIEPKVDDAHLFYHFNGERILLSRETEDKWVGKLDDLVLTTDELNNIAEQKPHLLSNNVLSRPLMQEMLFPTLAFIGGWGEISYWSVLKNAFHILDLKMPPVVPRLSFSYVDRKIAKQIEKYSLHYEKIISQGIYEERVNWLNSQPAYPTNVVAEQIKKDIKEIHRPLRKIAEKISPNLKELSETNVDYIQKNIDFLARSIKNELENTYKEELLNFAAIQMHLYPKNQLQERTLNILQFLNDYNKSFLKELSQETLPFTEEHFLVFL